MNQTTRNIYNRLPGAARSIAASLRGFQLRRLRYGPETHTLIDEALEREHWSKEKWTRWQRDKLAKVLQRAATKVPYYREQWAARHKQNDSASWEYLENWPILEKEEVRRNPLAFVADDCTTRRMFADHTSGTTGTQLELWLQKETVRQWYALFEARCRKWYGVSFHDRWGMLGGQLIAPVSQQRPPFWVWNAGLNQLYMSSYHLSPDFIPYYHDALKRYRIKYLLGYTSALYEIASGILEANRTDLKMHVVITNAEPLHDYQRRVIAEAFQCPVRETYGMAEIVSAASECEAGNLHSWPEAGITEVISDKETLTSTAAGELICTSLLNTDMPLIRYRVGDRAAFRPGNTKCPCSRTLPILANVEGRIDDTIYTRDGRRIGRLDTIFKSKLPIREAQIVQESLDLIRIRYVPAPTWTHATSKSLIQQIKSRVGNMNVVLEAVEKIPRGANGKFRAVLCELPASLRN